ncbi:hypothetical protein QZH41_004743 [Actinostola sp. cb2023]|nr:hypothetical protein QZH41_004743 [Actinostola sp. cb2023]
MDAVNSSDDKVKKSKPIMEKRRRARINESLSELKKLILEATKKDTSCYSKLEKADILDMIVRHLRTLKTQRNTSASTTDTSFTAHYRAGFIECTNEPATEHGMSWSTHPYYGKTSKAKDGPNMLNAHYHVLPGHLPNGNITAILVPSQSIGGVLPQQFIPVYDRPTIDSLHGPVSTHDSLWRPW